MSCFEVIRTGEGNKSLLKYLARDFTRSFVKVDIRKLGSFPRTKACIFAALANIYRKTGSCVLANLLSSGSMPAAKASTRITLLFIILITSVLCGSAQDTADSSNRPVSPLINSAVKENILRLANCVSCTILSASNIDLPNLGKHITLAKVFDSSRSTLTAIAVDERGVLVNRAETERAEGIARRIQRGALSESLDAWVHSVEPRESKVVRFSYWPTLDYPAKELLLTDSLVAQSWSEQVAQAEQLAQSIIRDCAARGAGEVVAAPSSTERLVRMTAGDLSRIKFTCDAEVDEIGHKVSPLAIPGDVSDVKISPLAVTGDVSDVIVNNASAWSSFTGSGVSVGVFEDAQPDKNYLWALTGIPPGGIEDPKAETSLHQVEVISVLRAASSEVPHGGVAPTVTTLVGTNSDNSVPWARNKGATIINRSYSSLGPGFIDTAMRWLDYQAKLPPYPLIVSAAGNDNLVGTSKSRVHNWHMDGLVVGGAESAGATSGGIRYTYTSPAGSWQNPPSPHGDRELPDLVAPLCYYTVPNGLACGTSIAAPQVAAAAARLLSYNSELKGWPEGLRAILQATADQHVDGEVWHTPGVDLKGGTGLLNVDRAFYAAQTRLTADATTNLNNGGVYGYAHGYAVGSLDRDTTPSVTYTVTVPPTPNPSCLIPHLRIAVAFDAAPVEANRADAEDILDADIDLIVTRGTDNAPASCYFANESFLSASYDNSYEFIECHVTNPDPNSTYKITVQGKGFNRSTAWYGLAVAKNDWAYGLNCF